MKRSLFPTLCLVGALALIATSLSQSSPAVKAGDQSWSSIPLPEVVGAGRIRDLAVVDANTAFAAASEAVTASGAASSYIIGTVDGGVTWKPVGNFDDLNRGAPPDLYTGGAETAGPTLSLAASPGTEIFLAASPNFGADRTLFVAVSDNTITAFQRVYRSRDGGGTFQLVGGGNFTGAGERIRAISAAPDYTETTDNTVVVGTLHPTDNAVGGLYFYQTNFGRGWSAKTGASDVYAARFTGGARVVVIGTEDTTIGPDSINEYRCTVVFGAVTLPATSPSLVPVGPTQPPTGQEDLRFQAVFPANWSAGTSTDTNVIAYSTGGTTPTGALYRRTGATAGYSMVSSSAAYGFASLAMTGGSSSGAIFAGAEVAPGAVAVVLHSPDGGQTWNSVPAGDRYGIDGVAPAGASTRVSVGIGASAVYVGTGGARGGVFRSPNLGSNWVDCALYSDTIDVNVDWNVVDQNDIFIVRPTATASETHMFKTTDGGSSWRRVSRTPNLQNVRASGNFATDYTVWASVSGVNTSQARRSVDGGYTWNATPVDPSDTSSSTSITADTDLRLWMVMNNGQIARTQDGGNTWTRSAASPTGPVMAVVKSPSFDADNTLLSMLDNTARTVWISRDAGAAWMQLGAAPPGADRGGVAFSPDYGSDRLIYAATRGADGGLWKLGDDGTVTTASVWTRIATVTDMQASVYDSAANTSTGVMVGASIFLGSTLFVPVGNRIASCFDPKATPLEWRVMPASDNSGAPNYIATTASRVTARMVGVYPTLWTNGANNTLLTLTDTSAAPVLPPTATPIPSTPAPKATPTPFAGNEIQLQQGWNLISMPEPLQDPSISAFFGQNPAVATVYSFQDGQWTAAARDSWRNRLSRVVDGKGYYVYATEATVVTLQFKPIDPKAPSPSYPLPAGWNLIGCTTLRLSPTQAVSSYLKSLGDKWEALYRYDPIRGWDIATPGIGFADMELGRGYWIYMTEAATLEP